MRRESTITLIIFGVILLAGAWYTWYVTTLKYTEAPAVSPAVNALTVAEGERSFTDLSGNQLSLTSHAGKVLIVNSWASWSPDSTRELKTLALLAQKYANKGVFVIAINRAEPGIVAKRFLDTIGIAEDVQLVLDPSDHYYRSIGGYTMPETVFYGVSGEITHQQHGALSLEQMVAYTESALLVAP
ncbi:TlpA family protein disulfide reductase [Candidatus Kaiserbacteria bacterium]|nr:TlpA family protein disulfide reductase [Candidatus Kaiserbacteria bacterium]NCT01903.1 TlpA family protein disulfide reductase [Candidatus Parcubacteria bacterium]